MLLHTRLHLRAPYSPTAHHSKPLPSSVQPHSPLPLQRWSLAHRAHPPLRHVASPAAEKGEGERERDDDEDLGPASAAAVAAAIRRASSASPVRFRRVRRVEAEEPHGEGALAEPSADFRRLCEEQLEMFRVVVSRDAVLSVTRASLFCFHLSGAWLAHLITLYICNSTVINVIKGVFVSLG